ncbi:MAG: ATP-binding protein [Candidatus Izemoplasma sp.]
MRKNVVKQLSEIDHILKRPGMYLGDTSVSKQIKWVLEEDLLLKKSVKICPAQLKMFDEIISNSIDEALRTDFKFANLIDVDIDGDTIIIKDNGRGISSEIDKETGKSQAEMAFTSLRAGGNFEDDDVVSIGTHGLGASLVNIFSKKFTASTHDGINLSVISSANNMYKTTYTSAPTNSKPYTKIKYTPDYARFGLKGLDEAHLKLLHKRVLDLAVVYPDIKFKWKKKLIKTKLFKHYIELLDRPAEILQTDNFRLAVVSSDEPDQISFVNGIDTYEGGTHVEYITNQITYKLRDLLLKKYKRWKIKPSDVKNHLTVVLITNKIKGAKFRSQTKEFITNPVREYKGILDIENDAFFHRLLRNQALIDPIIETYKLKQEVAERVANNQALRDAKKKKVLSHIPANHKNPEKRQLFISEGGSAIGSLSKVRDTAIHGGYPLRGKPMNVTGQSMAKILGNKELTDLMNIIGLEYGNPEYGKLNYGQINILADADLDGYSIVGLLLNFLRKWPRLFSEKRVHVVSSPILKAEFKKEVVYYYTLEDYNKAVSAGKVKGEITYLKGLGSLTEDAYEDMIHHPVIAQMSEVTAEDDVQLSVVYGNDPKKRKEWIMNND